MTDDKTIHHGFDSDLLKQRSRHDRLIPVEVRMGINRRTIQTAIRVASDAHMRLVLQREGLERAFDAVRGVMQAVGGGMLSKSSDYSGVTRKACGASGKDATLTHWISWAKSVKKSRLDMGIVEDIILMGKSTREIERERGKRNGSAMVVLINALRLW